MVSVFEAASFLRWRLVPLRYVGKLTRAHAPVSGPAHRLAVTARIARDGHADGPSMSSGDVAEVWARCADRIAAVVPKAGGHPFANLLGEDDLDAGNPLMKFAFSPEILDVADDYFDGRVILDSIQLLYSWPTDRLDASQYWHRDYGDNRSLHSITYLTDVIDDDCGPFTFVNRIQSRNIAGTAIIRRIADDRFYRELGDGQIRRFLANAGRSVWVDPSACWHFGSRCKVPRLALFVTFNTDRPFVPPIELVTANRERLLKVAETVRPDLDRPWLARLLRV